MGKSRDPLQVSPEFKKKLEELQIKIMKQKGKKLSYVDITQDIARNKFFVDLENSIIKGKDLDIDIKVHFDRRFL